MLPYKKHFRNLKAVDQNATSESKKWPTALGIHVVSTKMQETKKQIMLSKCNQIFSNLRTETFDITK